MKDFLNNFKRFEKSDEYIINLLKINNNPEVLNLMVLLCYNTQIDIERTSISFDIK